MSNIDAKTLELIASKICHDLISPIGAINNGLEIMEEIGPEDDVTDLIASSAHLASAKLKAFRIAYGAGGSDANIKISDAHRAIEDLIAKDGRVSQGWDANTRIGPELPPTGLAKMVTAFLLLAIECLPRGGVLKVTDAGDGQICIAGEGDRPIVKDGFEACLQQDVDLQDVSPALTHAFITGFLAKHYDYGLQAIESDDEGVRFTLTLPA